VKPVVALATIAVGVAGVVLAALRVAAGTPGDNYERVLRICWAVWLGLALLAITAGIRWLSHREVPKLASLYAFASLLAAIGYAAVIGLAFSGRFATVETVWSTVTGFVWPAVLLAFAWRGSRG
jgi:hypothetical protein